MIRVIAVFDIKPDDSIEKAIELARELVAETRKEAGCVQYDLIQSVTEVNQLVILEGWETQADLDKHSASAHFSRLVPMLAELSATAPVVSNYSQIM